MIELALTRRFGRIAKTTSALVLLAFGFGAPSLLRAEPYSAQILVDNDQDIFDLEANGEITSEERDRLLAMLESPIDLNTASRNELYELPNVTYSMVDAILRLRQSRGRFESPYELRGTAGLPDDVYLQILPFVAVAPPPEARAPDAPLSYKGRARMGVADRASLPDNPTTYAHLDFSLNDWFRVGWIGLLRDEPGRLSYVGEPSGANRYPYFFADPMALRIDPWHRLYLTTTQDIGKGMRIRAIGGSYVIGFGERLTLDNSQRSVRPYGWSIDDVVIAVPQSGTFRTRPGFFGAAVTLEQIPVAESVRLDITSFFSMQQPRLYQYDFNVTWLDDDGIRKFQSPTIYFDNDGSAEDGPTRCSSEGRCHTYTTFPRVTQEIVVGGNATMFFGDRAQFGVTGLWAQNSFVVGDEQIVFARAARQPMRPNYWVVGADGAWGYGIVDVFGEIAFMDNGGMAAVARALVDFGEVFVETTGRYYGATFDNPKTRARAQPDEFLGGRARDEAGGRVLVEYQPFKWLRFQGYVDVWNRLLADVNNLEGGFRVNWDIHKEWKVSTWFNLRDKDLSAGGRGEDYNASFVFDFDEVDLIAANDFGNTAVSGGGRGMLLNWYGRFAVNAIPLTSLVATYRLAWRDVGVKGFEDKFERSYTASLLATFRPIPELTLSVRGRLLDDDWDDLARGDRYWEIYAQVRSQPIKGLSLAVRYDYRDFIREDDERPSLHLVRSTVDWKF